MGNVYREACFSQKMLLNGLNMGLPQQAWVEKQWKYTDSPV